MTALVVLRFADNAGDRAAFVFDQLDGRRAVKEFRTLLFRCCGKKGHDVSVVLGFRAIRLNDGRAEVTLVVGGLRCGDRARDIVNFCRALKHPHVRLAGVIDEQLQQVGIHAIAAGFPPSLHILQDAGFVAFFQNDARRAVAVGLHRALALQACDRRSFFQC